MQDFTMAVFVLTQAVDLKVFYGTSDDCRCAASHVPFSLSFVFPALAGSPGSVAQPWRSCVDQELARLRRASDQVAALRPSGAPAVERRGKVQDSVNNPPENTKLKEHGVQDWVSQALLSH